MMCRLFEEGLTFFVEFHRVLTWVPAFPVSASNAHVGKVGAPAVSILSSECQLSHESDLEEDFPSVEEDIETQVGLLPKDIVFTPDIERKGICELMEQGDEARPTDFITESISVIEEDECDDDFMPLHYSPKHKRRKQPIFGLKRSLPSLSTESDDELSVNADTVNFPEEAVSSILSDRECSQWSEEAGDSIIPNSNSLPKCRNGVGSESRQQLCIELPRGESGGGGGKAADGIVSPNSSTSGGMFLSPQRRKYSDGVVRRMKALSPLVESVLNRIWGDVLDTGAQDETEGQPDKDEKDYLSLSYPPPVSFDISQPVTFISKDERIAEESALPTLKDVGLNIDIEGDESDANPRGNGTKALDRGVCCDNDSHQETNDGANMLINSNLSKGAAHNLTTELLNSDLCGATPINDNRSQQVDNNYTMSSHSMDLKTDCVCGARGCDCLVDGAVFGDRSQGGISDAMFIRQQDGVYDILCDYLNETDDSGDMLDTEYGEEAAELPGMKLTGGDEDDCDTENDLSCDMFERDDSQVGDDVVIISESLSRSNSGSNSSTSCSKPLPSDGLSDTCSNNTLKSLSELASAVISNQDLESSERSLSSTELTSSCLECDIDCDRAKTDDAQNRTVELMDSKSDDSCSNMLLVSSINSNSSSNECDTRIENSDCATVEITAMDLMGQGQDLQGPCIHTADRRVSDGHRGHISPLCWDSLHDSTAIMAQYPGSYDDSQGHMQENTDDDYLPYDAFPRLDCERFMEMDLHFGSDFSGDSDRATGSVDSDLGHFSDLDKDEHGHHVAMTSSPREKVAGASTESTPGKAGFIHAGIERTKPNMDENFIFPEEICPQLSLESTANNLDDKGGEGTGNGAIECCQTTNNAPASEAASITKQASHFPADPTDAKDPAPSGEDAQLSSFVLGNNTSCMSDRCNATTSSTTNISSNGNRFPNNTELTPNDSQPVVELKGEVYCRDLKHVSSEEIHGRCCSPTNQQPRDIYEQSHNYNNDQVPNSVRCQVGTYVGSVQSEITTANVNVPSPAAKQTSSDCQSPSDYAKHITYAKVNDFEEGCSATNNSQGFLKTSPQDHGDKRGDVSGDDICTDMGNSLPECDWQPQVMENSQSESLRDYSATKTTHDPSRQVLSPCAWAVSRGSLLKRRSSNEYLAQKPVNNRRMRHRSAEDTRTKAQNHTGDRHLFSLYSCDGVLEHSVLNSHQSEGSCQTLKNSRKLSHSNLHGLQNEVIYSNGKAEEYDDNCNTRAMIKAEGDVYSKYTSPSAFAITTLSTVADGSLARSAPTARFPNYGIDNGGAWQLVLDAAAEETGGHRSDAAHIVSAGQTHGTGGQTAAHRQNAVAFGSSVATVSDRDGLNVHNPRQGVAWQSSSGSVGPQERCGVLERGLLEENAVPTGPCATQGSVSDVRSTHSSHVDHVGTVLSDRATYSRGLHEYGKTRATRLSHAVAGACPRCNNLEQNIAASSRHPECNSGCHGNGGVVGNGRPRGCPPSAGNTSSAILDINTNPLASNNNESRANANVFDNTEDSNDGNDNINANQLEITVGFVLESETNRNIFGSLDNITEPFSTKIESTPQYSKGDLNHNTQYISRRYSDISRQIHLENSVYKYSFEHSAGSDSSCCSSDSDDNSSSSEDDLDLEDAVNLPSLPQVLRYPGVFHQKFVDRSPESSSCSSDQSTPSDVPLKPEVPRVPFTMSGGHYQHGRRHSWDGKLPGDIVRSLSAGPDRTHLSRSTNAMHDPKKSSDYMDNKQWLDSQMDKLTGRRRPTNLPVSFHNGGMEILVEVNDVDLEAEEVATHSASEIFPESGEVPGCTDDEAGVYPSLHDDEGSECDSAYTDRYYSFWFLILNVRGPN